ncbi:glycosyl-transferase for dystroglycan-domain-containing protein [Hyaloraphidium curvatum]|nr:glycosyl-transferase for dystroglycan-domain-containing protein [Hyaloraphidium curvatum]
MVPATAVGEGIFDYASKDFMLSKLFQFAMKPYRIEPFYIRAEERPDAGDITITTMLDPSRYDRLLKLVYQYRGPISVTIHIQDDEENQVEEAIADLDELVHQHPILAKYVDAHLLIDRFDRQFNLWRNVARFFARSKYVVQLDVDFFVCTDFRTSILGNPELLRKMDREKAVLVIPAFEFSNELAPRTEADRFPRTKEAMVDAYKRGEIAVFHADWERGHGPTDYGRWFRAREAYQISTYNFNYEPYVVMRRDDPPWCDERFVGYGSNKAACLYEIYLAGYEFWVLPGDFLIHQWHEYPSEERTAERRYNRRLYETFREETCFRYNRVLQMASGGSDTDLLDRLDCMQFAKAHMSHGLIRSADGRAIAEAGEEEVRDRGL